MAPMRHWKIDTQQTLFNHRLFRLEHQHLAAGEARREALVLDAPDWVNVIPRLPDGRVLLVRQWRYGIAAPTLEIPGGMVDAGEALLEAAKRELLEETGYRAGRWTELGALHPNPAFIRNSIVVYLADELEQVGEPEGDGEEEIQLETADLEEIPNLILRGEITHSLVVAAFYLFDQRPQSPPS